MSAGKALIVIGIGIAISAYLYRNYTRYNEYKKKEEELRKQAQADVVNSMTAYFEQNPIEFARY